MKIRILKEKKDCFKKKDFKSKSTCVQDQKGIGEKRGNAYVASVLRDQGEIEEEQLEEMSGMAGGAVGGAAGNAFEDDENLEEMYSTKGAFPSKMQRIQTDGEVEGKIERGRHQGLKNYKESFHNQWKDFLILLEDDDSTQPLDDAERLPIPPNPTAELLKKAGYKLIKELGAGQFGEVVLASAGDEYGSHNYAIKIIKPGNPDAAFREVRNYHQISKARSNNPLIAEHFPEVFKILKIDDKDIIVMEVLDPLPASLKGIFVGVEQAMHRMRPVNAPTWPISKFDDSKDVSERVELLIMRDDSPLNDLMNKIKKTLKVFSREESAETGKYTLPPQAIKDIDTTMSLPVYRSWLGLDKHAGPDIINQFHDEILNYLGAAAPVYMAIMEDLEESWTAKAFVTLVCKNIIDLMKKYTVHPPDYDDSYDPDEGITANVEYIIESFLERFQKLYRMGSSLKSGYSPTDVGSEGGRLADAESLYQAIMALQEETGLFARDLHDKNAMIRPDGDIVIVDVGMFKTDREIDQMKKGKLRENRIRIKFRR
tara:strand:- start:1576 stop:3198 length:1623 start_codon:yes stop_codon:yes gene_type:complete